MLRNQHGRTLRPHNRIKGGSPLIAEIGEGGGVKKKIGPRGTASSDSEEFCVSDVSDEPQAPKETDRDGKSTSCILRTKKRKRRKRRKRKGRGSLESLTSISQSDDRETVGGGNPIRKVKSSRQTQSVVIRSSPRFEVQTSNGDQQQQRGTHYTECGCAADEQGPSFKLGLKRKQGRCDDDELSCRVNLTLRQQTCPAWTGGQSRKTSEEATSDSSPRADAKCRKTKQGCSPEIGCIKAATKDPQDDSLNQSLWHIHLQDDSGEDNLLLLPPGVKRGSGQSATASRQKRAMNSRETSVNVVMGAQKSDVVDGNCEEGLATEEDVDSHNQKTPASVINNKDPAVNKKKKRKSTDVHHIRVPPNLSVLTNSQCTSDSAKSTAERVDECLSTTSDESAADKTTNELWRNRYATIHTGKTAESTTKCVDIAVKHSKSTTTNQGHKLLQVDSDMIDLVDGDGAIWTQTGRAEDEEVEGEDGWFAASPMKEECSYDEIHHNEDEGDPSMSFEVDNSVEEVKDAHPSESNEDDIILVNIGKNDLKRSDLDTLEEGEWLNDCVINAYLFLLSQASPLKIFTHSSFFFLSLYKRGYEGVQRWTKNVDLFAQDLIFIPIHNKSHWTLAVVHVQDRLIEYYNSSTWHNGYPHGMKYIKDYLRDEAAYRGKTDFLGVKWEMFIVGCLPMQQNSDDCGLFLCQYAKKLSLKQKVKFNTTNTVTLRRQMLQELLHRTIEDGKSRA